MCLSLSGSVVLYIVYACMHKSSFDWQPRQWHRLFGSIQYTRILNIYIGRRDIVCISIHIISTFYSKYRNKPERINAREWQQTTPEQCTQSTLTQLVRGVTDRERQQEQHQQNDAMNRIEQNKRQFLQKGNVMARIVCSTLDSVVALFWCCQYTYLR